MRKPDNSDYLRLLKSVNTPSETLFTTDASGLFEAYLAEIPAEERQHHNCNSCRRFIENYGGLVHIDDNGITHAAIWNQVLGFYERSIARIIHTVNRAKVTGVFLSETALLGTPKTGDWTHLSVKLDAVWKNKLLTASQKQAEFLQDFLTVKTAIRELGPSLATAVNLLRSDALYRSEKVLGQAEWLFTLHGSNYNQIWRAVATAPAGFCHPRSSMIGTLLEDISSGMSLETVKRRFADKMNPVVYQRPTTLKQGNIAVAEKIVEKLGIAKSLERRFAKLEEIQKIWEPSTVARAGVFSHLLPSQVVSGGNITWVKFLNLLPAAAKIEYYVPSQKSSFCAYVTAQWPDAPLIFQWNNPFSWYVWNGGSYPADFGISYGWKDVTALSYKPSMWDGDKLSYHGNGVLFVLENARETKNNSSAIFPECLKAEFHQIRATIEANSNSTRIGGFGEEHVAGILHGKDWNCKVRVTNSLGTNEYTIDRWD